MRIRVGTWLKRGFALLCGLLVAGCVEVETELWLGADGRGSVRTLVRVNELSGALMQLGQMVTPPDPKAGAPALDSTPVDGGRSRRHRELVGTA